MFFDDFTIPGDYSDYYILKEEKKLYPKIMEFGSKLKRDMERESTVNSLQFKKRG